MKILELLKDLISISKFDGLVQERHNSIANALKLCPSCTNPLKCSYFLTSLLRISITLHGMPFLKHIFKLMKNMLQVAWFIIRNADWLESDRRPAISTLRAEEWRALLLNVDGWDYNIIKHVYSLWLYCVEETPLIFAFHILHWFYAYDDKQWHIQNLQ